MKIQNDHKKLREQADEYYEQNNHKMREMTEIDKEINALN